MNAECRLCGAPGRALGVFHARAFFECGNCFCAFVPVSALPPPEEEKARYLLHRNDPTPAYQTFLNRLAAPMVARLPKGARGLDFGCGPSPVLSRLFEEQGFSMCHYDPLFYADEKVLAASYDFVSCSETAEHFHYPEKGFRSLMERIKPGGLLGIMTQMLDEWSGLSTWYYARDPTHVVFYSPRSMRWIGRRWGWPVEFCPQNVVLFQRPMTQQGPFDRLGDYGLPSKV